MGLAGANIFRAQVVVRGESFVKIKSTKTGWARMLDGFQVAFDFCFERKRAVEKTGRRAAKVSKRAKDERRHEKSKIKALIGMDFFHLKVPGIYFPFWSCEKVERIGIRHDPLSVLRQWLSGAQKWRAP